MKNVRIKDYVDARVDNIQEQMDRKNGDYLKRDTYFTMFQATEKILTELSERITRIESENTAARRTLVVAISALGVLATIVAIVVPLIATRH